MPTVGDDDVFEETYLDKLRVIWSRLGLKVAYPRDGAALDGGMHLYERSSGIFPGNDQILSQTRVWYQAKGKRTGTISTETFTSSETISVPVPIDHLRFWYASPEPVYLIVYIESMDTFLAEDIREIVDRQWRWQSFYQALPAKQASVSLKVRTAAVLNDDLITRMLRHRSMRIDGPSFRGRPLGHRYDPLRSEILPFVADMHGRVVDRLLEVHDFRPVSHHCVSSKFASSRLEALRIIYGKFHQTLEWQWPAGTAKGVGDDENEVQAEAPVDFVRGDCLVIVDSNVDMSRYQQEESAALVEMVRSIGCARVLIFVNGPEQDGFGLWRGALNPLVPPSEGFDFWPIALGTLTNMLLVASLVYLEFAPLIRWRYRNFL